MKKGLGWSGLILLGGCVSVSAQEEVPLVEWLVGDFTNYQQTLAEPEQALVPVVHRVRDIDLEHSDGTPLLVEQFALFEQTNVLRTQVHVIEPVRQGYRQHVYDIDGDPLNENNWQVLHGCRIDWQWQNDSWLGKRDPRRCYFYDRDSQVRVGLGAEVVLSETMFSVQDSIQYADGTPLMTDDVNGHYQYARMQYAIADVEYKAPGTSEWLNAEPLSTIHDQGVRVGFKLADSDLELRYQLELTRIDDTHQVQLFHMHEAGALEQIEGQLADVIEIETDTLRVRLREASSPPLPH